MQRDSLFERDLSVACIGELGLLHDQHKYEGYLSPRESAAEEDKLGKRVKLLHFSDDETDEEA